MRCAARALFVAWARATREASARVAADFAVGLVATAFVCACGFAAGFAAPVAVGEVATGAVSVIVATAVCVSASAVATLEESARAERLARVGALYDDLGRGPDGLRLPYVTLCYRAQVIHPPKPPRRPPVEMTEDGPAETGTAPAPEASEPRQPEPPADPGHLLIDFR